MRVSDHSGQALQPIRVLRLDDLSKSSSLLLAIRVTWSKQVPFQSFQKRHEELGFAAVPQVVGIWGYEEKLTPEGTTIMQRLD